MPQINIKNAPADNALLWVDEIPALEITTDLQKVSVAILRGTTEIYSQTLYPYKGTLSVYVADIIAEEMAIKEATAYDFKVIFTGEFDVAASVSLRPVYRRRGGDISAKEFCARNFLTLSQVRRMPLAGSDTLYFLQAPNEQGDAVLEVIYRKPDGSFDRKAIRSPGTSPDAPMLMAAEIEWPEVPEGCVPLTLSFSIGRRRCTWYRMKHADMVFFFDNAFGVPEKVYLCGAVSCKHTSKSSLARIRGRLIPYDEEITEETTTRLAPMLPAEVSRLSQIADARNPQWQQLPTGKPTNIVISSATFEADEDPDELPTPEITFRRTNLMPWERYPTDGRIFTQNFTEPFT